MTSTGIVRKIDELGRIVLPSEIRQTLDLQVRDAMEIFTDGERIVLQKYRPGCLFCGGLEGLKSFEGKHICPACIAKMSAL